MESFLAFLNSDYLKDAMIVETNKKWNDPKYVNAFIRFMSCWF